MSDNFPAFQPCLACYKGDTATLLAAQGEAEFLEALMIKIGVTDQDARALVLKAAREQYKCDPGKVPEIDMEMVMRVCSECAAKASLTVGSEEAVPLYTQPEKWKRGMKLDENPPWR